MADKSRVDYLFCRCDIFLLSAVGYPFLIEGYNDIHFSKTNLNASRPSEHPPVRGKMSKCLGDIMGCISLIASKVSF